MNYEYAYYSTYFNWHIKEQDPEANTWPNRDANEEWKRVHNKKLHSLCRSPNIARAIKSIRLRWADHVARLEEIGVLSKF